MNWNVWQCLYKNKQILRHLYFCSSLAVLGTSPVYRQNTRWTLVGIFVSTIRLFEAPIKCPPVETIPQKVGPWLFGNATMSPRIGMDTGWKLRHAWMTSDCLFPHSEEAAGEYPQNLRWMEQYSTWLSKFAQKPYHMWFFLDLSPTKTLTVIHVCWVSFFIFFHQKQ